MTDLELARECGAVSLTFVNRESLPESQDGVAFHPAQLSTFTQRIRQEEREAAAKAVEALRDDHQRATQEAGDPCDHSDCDFVAAWDDAAAAIRNRGQSNA